jgi:large subunit ribosomal protein L15
MVVRKDKKNRKYFGTRRWGAGNIKNARGAGDRGGVGKGGRKHKFTRITAKTPWLIHRKGFTKWNQRKLQIITLDGINKMFDDGEAKGSSIELPYHKVLSNGSLRNGIKVSASAFSAKAIEKIKGSGGEAVVIKGQDKEAE